MSQEETRRGFLGRLAMITGLAAAGAALAGIAGRYIYPVKAFHRKRNIYLAPVSDIPAGKGRPYTLPGGGTALVTDTGGTIVALSDICPHLGCKVHYEPEARQFICPCHGGVFDSNGTAVAGPPADEKKDLKRYEVARVGENLFIEIDETIEI